MDPNPCRYADVVCLHVGPTCQLHLSSPSHYPLSSSSFSELMARDHQSLREMAGVGSDTTGAGMSGGLGWYAYDHMEPVEMSLHMDIGLDPSKT
jgi:hypothetical protein